MIALLFFAWAQVESERLPTWDPDVEQITRGIFVRHADTRLAGDWLFFWSLILAESAGNPSAESHVGAYGLGQTMPSTAKGYGVENWGSRPMGRRFRVETGARLAILHLNTVWRFIWSSRRAMNPTSHRDGLLIAAAGYNAGHGNIGLISSRGKLRVVGHLVRMGLPMTIENVLSVLHLVTGHHATETRTYVNRIDHYEDLQRGQHD